MPVCHFWIPTVCMFCAPFSPAGDAHGVLHGGEGGDRLTFAGSERIKTVYRYPLVQREARLGAKVANRSGVQGAVRYSVHLKSRQQARSRVMSACAGSGGGHIVSLLSFSPHSVHHGRTARPRPIP